MSVKIRNYEFGVRNLSKHDGKRFGKPLTPQIKAGIKAGAKKCSVFLKNHKSQILKGGLFALAGFGAIYAGKKAYDYLKASKAEPKAEVKPEVATQEVENKTENELMGDSYTVKSGDNLWNIAKAHLKEQNKDVKGYEPSGKEIHKHVKELMEINGLKYEKDDYTVIIRPGDEIKFKADEKAETPEKPTNSEVKPEAKPEVKPEVKPEAKPEEKVEEKVEEKADEPTLSKKDSRIARRSERRANRKAVREERKEYRAERKEIRKAHRAVRKEIRKSVRAQRQELRAKKRELRQGIRTIRLESRQNAWDDILEGRSKVAELKNESMAEVA